MTDDAYPQPPPVSQDGQMGSMAAALRMKLENLPQLNIHNLNLHRSQSNRRFHEINSASSSRSAHSFSDQQSDDTDATDLTLTPNRSRASTFDNAERITSPLVQSRCKPPLRVVLGTASMGSEASPLAKINTVRDAQKFVNLFRSRGYADIDTARAYPVGKGGTCEELLGREDLRLSKWANVSTKVASFMPGSHRASRIAMSIDRSLDALSMESVDIMYLHAPDRFTPFKETCEAMNKAYQQGKFERFGLSNYSVEEVEEIVRICEENGYVKPSVYQGQYNPICRGGEERLFSVLREHNIAFYAYSPSACGFFSNKVSRASTKDKNSRWNIASPLGAKYAGDYFHDPLFAAAEIVRQQALKHGISGHAAALRWTTWHSQLGAEYGDAVIVGASKLSQLEENMCILEEGPLPEDLVDTLNGVWEDVKSLDKGPRFSFV
ncbi:Aldo-keto reductase [Exophiala dermatitidis]